MDAALLASTLLTTAYVAPICVSQNEFVFSRRKRNWFALQVVVVLGFVLFALSVIECVPSRYLLLFANDHEDEEEKNEVRTVRAGSGKVSLATAYSTVLTGLCGCLLIVFPVVIGTHLIPTKRRDPDAPGAADNYLYYRRCPKALLRASKLVVALVHAAYAVLSFILHGSLRFASFVCRRGGRHAAAARRGTSGVGVGRRDSASLLPLKSVSSHDHHQEQLEQARRVRTVSGRIVGAVAAVAVWWTFLGLLAPFVIQVPRPSSWSSFSATASEYDGPSTYEALLTVAIARLCAVGLLLSAVVNGFGSVSFPFASLTPFYLTHVTNESVAIAESELTRLQATLEERRYQMLGLSSSSLLATAGSGSGSHVVTGKSRNSSFSDLGDDLVQRRASLSSEITFIQALIEDTKDDVDEMKHAQRVSSRARTTSGRVLSWLGLVMSIVLLVRLLTITISLNWWSAVSRTEISEVQESLSASEAPPPSPRTDLVTRLLLWMVGHTSLVSSRQQLSQLSQFVSVVLSAFLSVSQVQTFLRTVSVVNRRLSSFFNACNCQPSSHHRPSPPSSSSAAAAVTDPRQLLASTVYSYGLATLAGCYFVACVVLTKLMLPEPYRRSFTRALLGSSSSTSSSSSSRTSEAGQADGGHRLLFWIRSDAVNLVFIVTALVSAFVLGALFGIQRQNTHRYASWSTSTTKTRPDRPRAVGASMV